MTKRNKNGKNSKSVTDRPTDRQTDWPTDGRTDKAGCCRVHATKKLFTTTKIP